MPPDPRPAASVLPQQVSDTDALTEALTMRVREGIARDGWKAVAIAGGRALPAAVRVEWLGRDVGVEDDQAIVVVFQRTASRALEARTPTEPAR